MVTEEDTVWLIAGVEDRVVDINYLIDQYNLGKIDEDELAYSLAEEGQKILSMAEYTGIDL